MSTSLLPLHDRKDVDLGYARFTLTEQWGGYRVAHSKMRTPVVGGEDTWVPNHTWPLPATGLTEQEATELMERLDAEARRRYQLQQQRLAVQRRRAYLRREARDDPAAGAEVKTEERRDGGTMNWIE